jgi:hypothetical protein
VALKENLEPEVAAAVVVTAAIASPPVRKVLRRGLFYGLVGLFSASDKLAFAARSTAQSAQQAIEASGDGKPGTSATSAAPQAKLTMKGQSGRELPHEGRALMESNKSRHGKQVVLIGLEAANLYAAARVLRAGVTVVETRPERAVELPDALVLDRSRLFTCWPCAVATMQIPR